MYLVRENKLDIIKRKKVAEKVGIHMSTMSRITTGKQMCSKKTAFCIAKAICESAEIEDFFTRV